MGHEIAALEEWTGGRRRRIERAVLLHGTSPLRSAIARQLGRLVTETGATGAAFGWANPFSPHVVTPVHVVAAAPAIDWDARLAGSFARLVNRDERREWRLVLRGVTRERCERLAASIEFSVGYLLGRRDLEVPRPPAEVPRFIEGLQAYQFFGFASPDRTVTRAVQGSFRASAESLPAGAQSSAEGVVAALTRPELLSTALLQLGRTLDREGSLSDAAAVLLVGYELAVARNDAGAGAEFARALGRVYRLRTTWEEAQQWYELAERLAVFEERWAVAALALDGLGNTFRQKGAVHRARELYGDAWSLAVRSDDGSVLGAVAQNLLRLHREAGDFGQAADFAWAALQSQADPAGRARLLVEIGTLMVDLGDLEAAGDAYRTALRDASEVDTVAIAADALAYVTALSGDEAAYERRRTDAIPHARRSSSYVRAQIGLYRARSLLLFDRPAAALRVLDAVERFGRSRGLTQYQVTAGELRDSITHREPPPVPAPARAPSKIRRGLRALANA